MKNEFLLFFCFVFRSVEVHFFFFGSQASNRQTQAASSRRERFSFFPCCSRPPCSRLLNCSLCPLVSRALETLVQPTSHAPGRALAAREQRRKGRRSSRSSGLRRRCCSILALAAALPPGAPRVLAGQQQLASQHDDGEPGSKRGPERLLAQLPAGGCSGQGRFGSRSSSSAATATTSEMGRNSEEGATAAAAETCASCSSALRRAQLRPASVAARAAEPDRRVHARVSYENEIIGGGIEKKRETEKRKKFIAHGIAQASLAGVRIFFFSTSSLFPSGNENTTPARKTLSPRPTRPWRTTIRQQQQLTGAAASSRDPGTPARPPQPRRRRSGVLPRERAGAGSRRQQLAVRRQEEERWAGKTRSSSNKDRGARSSSRRLSCRRCSAATTAGRGLRPSPPTSSCPARPLFVPDPLCPAAGPAGAAEEVPPQRQRQQQQHRRRPPSLRRSRCLSSRATPPSFASSGRWAPGRSRGSSGRRTGSTGGSTRSRSRRRSCSPRLTWRGGGRRRRRWLPRGLTEVRRGFFFFREREKKVFLVT